MLSSKRSKSIEFTIPSHITLIAGVDEVGRGPLAGPVIAAAVILRKKARIRGLKDSKQLTPEKREQLFPRIQEAAVAWAIGRAEVAEIDQLNIFRASLLAMKRAVEALSVFPEFVLIDGTHCPPIRYPAHALIRGDQLVPAISAASILAKVTRDAEMVEWDKVYPNYGFADHKGYATPQHVAALKKLGPTALHRRSFSPVQTCLELEPSLTLASLSKKESMHK